MRLPPVVAAFSLAALLVVALAPARTPGKARGRPRPALTVSGGVGSLYPGAHARLPVVVRSNRGFRIRVVLLTVRVGNARPGCGHAYVSVRRLHRSFVVAPHGFRTLTLPVTMLRRAPDACKRAVFPLRFTALGRRA